MSNGRERSTDERLDGLDERMDTFGQRMDGLDQRMAGVEQKLDGLAEKIDTLIGGVIRRLDGIDNRLDKLEIIGNDTLAFAKNLTDGMNTTRDNVERGFKNASDDNRKEFHLVHDAIRYWGTKVTGLEGREQGA